MYRLGDTISAISTPIGQGGIGIVRLSGPEALSILRRIFRGPEADGDIWPSRHLLYGHIFDPESGQVVDEVLACYMQAPHTYTREDVVEVDCHGGPVPLSQVLELTLRYGARLAYPGEMTLRAFLNGRIDLAQAEAVLDIVQAKTEASLRVAMSGLEGRLSQETKGLRRALVEVLAYLEATIDAEEDIPPQDLSAPLAQAQARLEKLLEGADQGIIYRQGVRVAIVGRPNVGKSSLLNALLGTSRAIVTPIPGTTRDTLEETINLKGVAVVLVDTAGIAPTDDPVGRLGVERSRQALEGADLVLLVVDGSEPWQEADGEIASLVRGKPAVLVVNKADLPLLIAPRGIPPGTAQVVVSALIGEGLEGLREALWEAIFAGGVVAPEETLVANPRHRDILRRASGHLAAARESEGQGLPADFISIDLTAAVSALGEITGETASADLIEALFSNFCLGK